MSTYIQVDDVTDPIILAFEEALQNKLELSDDAVEDLADIKGVSSSDQIKTDPVHFQLKRYAIYWTCAEICLDYLGTNNVDVVEQEKYHRKYDIYDNLRKEYAQSITAQMITGTAYNQRDRATVGTALLFRG